MSNWNNNDREQSKPNWLTEEQKRQCIRTARGWEIPMSGTPIDATSDSHIDYEVLVCLSNDGTVTRSVDPTTNDAPYFSIPLTGDSHTAGGPTSDGLTYCQVAQGTTSYVPLVFGDPDSTDVYSSLVISGPYVDGVIATAGSTFVLLTPGTYIGASAGLGYPKAGFIMGYTGSTATNILTSSLVSGYLGGITDGAALLRIGSAAVTADYAIQVRGWDDSGTTADITFRLRVGYTGDAY